VSPSDEDVAATKATVQQVRTYLDTVAQAVSRLPAFTSLSQTTIDGYTAAVATARANVSGYSTSLSAAATAYNNARTAVKTAENQLALKKAGSSEEEVRAQAAQVRAAEASLNNAYAQSAKRVIVAPFSGTVTSVDLKEGQVVSGGTSTITLISAAKLQVEAYVPEVYIAKVKLNDPANVTLDAYGSNVVFPATVSSIDPAATKRDGIATYKIVLALDAPDARIKAGMGGDIVIKTKAASTIITIPKRALVTRNGKSYVQIPTGVEGRVVEREVNVGKINEANVAEISAGLSDGDTIVLDPIQ
jgi:HlyD family secretion protein